MWHPLIHRDWVDENNFKIINTRRNLGEKFPIFLEIKNSVKEEKENIFLNNDKHFNSNKNNKKLNCDCKFVKENPTTASQGIQIQTLSDDIKYSNNFIREERNSPKNLLKKKINIENDEFAKDNNYKNQENVRKFNNNSLKSYRTLDKNFDILENDKNGLSNNKFFEGKIIEISNKVFDNNTGKNNLLQNRDSGIAINNQSILTFKF